MKLKDLLEIASLDVQLRVREIGAGEPFIGEYAEQLLRIDPLLDREVSYFDSFDEFHITITLEV